MLRSSSIVFPGPHYVAIYFSVNTQWRRQDFVTGGK